MHTYLDSVPVDKNDMDILHAFVHVPKLYQTELIEYFRTIGPGGCYRWEP